jgi:hypothetical protein
MTYINELKSNDAVEGLALVTVVSRYRVLVSFQTSAALIVLAVVLLSSSGQMLGQFLTNRLQPLPPASFPNNHS